MGNNINKFFSNMIYKTIFTTALAACLAAA